MRFALVLAVFLSAAPAFANCTNPVSIELKPGETKLRDATDLIDGSNAVYFLVGTQFFTEFQGAVFHATSTQEPDEAQVAQVDCYSFPSKMNYSSHFDFFVLIRARDGSIPVLRRQFWNVPKNNMLPSIEYGEFESDKVLLPIERMGGTRMKVNGIAVRKADGNYELRLQVLLPAVDGKSTYSAWVVMTYKKIVELI